MITNTATDIGKKKLRKRSFSFSFSLIHDFQFNSWPLTNRIKISMYYTVSYFTNTNYFYNTIIFLYYFRQFQYKLVRLVAKNKEQIESNGRAENIDSMYLVCRRINQVIATYQQMIDKRIKTEKGKQCRNIVKSDKIWPKAL